MDNKIKKRFSDAILKQAIGYYGVAEDKIQMLDGFESFIYEFERGDEAGILRIGHSMRRGGSLVSAEVNFLNYLTAGGAAVATPILSKNGRYVETVDDGHGDEFVATAFHKAEGKPPWECGWTPERWQSYGRLIGRVHALSKTYRPLNPDIKRPEWDEGIMQAVDRNLPAGERAVLLKYRQLVDTLQNLPRDGDSYGLVHYDPHEANLLMDAVGQLTLIDFDDCAYCWYVYDLAMVLFYSPMGKEDVPGFIDQVMPHFLCGYSQETRLDPRWLREIPHFLKQREIDLYAAIHRSFDVENIDNPWVVRFMQGRRQRIESDVPVVDYDFSSLAKYLDISGEKPQT